MKLKLIKLTKEYELGPGEMIDGWEIGQEINNINASPRSVFRDDYHDFDYYLYNLGIKSKTGNKVPDPVFFLLDEERDRFLEAVNIRHYLSESFLKGTGHIGDGVRSSEREKGHATGIVRPALIECKKLGVERVLMICDKENIGSAKSIIKNGGVPENESINSSGKTIQRYWIDN